MNLKKFHLKIKAFRLANIFGGDGKKRTKKESESSKNPVKASWMTPVSHGYRIVEEPIGKTPSIFDQIDSVVVQRDKIEEQELWFFGVFVSKVVADKVGKYLQTNLFDLKNKKVLVKSKEVLRKAHQNAITSVKEKDNDSKNPLEMNGISAIVINGEKLIIASVGGYRAVICRDGKAFPASSKRHNEDITKPHWSQKFIPGFLGRRPGEGIFGSSNNTSNTSTEKKAPSAKISSKPHIASEIIDHNTEFVILASTGIWEVMKDQEAVNLISHIGDPQEAAECLTNEAITRTSRSNISCLLIRFDHFT